MTREQGLEELEALLAEAAGHSRESPFEAAGLADMAMLAKQWTNAVPQDPELQKLLQSLEAEQISALVQRGLLSIEPSVLMRLRVLETIKGFLGDRKLKIDAVLALGEMQEPSALPWLHEARDSLQKPVYLSPRTESRTDDWGTRERRVGGGLRDPDGAVREAMDDAIATLEVAQHVREWFPDVPGAAEVVSVAFVETGLNLYLPESLRKHLPAAIAGHPKINVITLAPGQAVPTGPERWQILLLPTTRRLSG